MISYYLLSIIITKEQLLVLMQDTIKLLGAIDTQMRKQSLNPTKPWIKRGKFTFAKVLDFHEDKFQEYPKWLTDRQDFLNFMYEKYQSKLLSIPKICQKTQRSGEQKYLLGLLLEQTPTLEKLPQIIKEIIIDKLQTRYYSSNQIIHRNNQLMEFMAIIYIGSTSHYKNNKKIVNNKNDVIMTEAFYNKRHEQIIAREETVLLVLPKEVYGIIQKKISEDIQQKSRDQIDDLIKSDFFIQLHLKDKKAKKFFSLFKPEFYFKGENICNAGETPEKFYIVFKGEVKELNHIYIREHNKWPLEVKRWEVRAVYNAFENIGSIKQFNFFGDQEIVNGLKLKSTFKTQVHTLLFSIQKDTFIDSLSNEDFKRLKKYRNEHININYSQFQKEVRERVKSVNERKKIIHKAIDTSFAHKNVSDLNKRKVSLVSSFERHMLESGSKKNTKRSFL